MNMSLKMRVVADEHDWDSLCELEQERRDLLQLFFTKPADKDEASVLVQGIKKMLSLNKEIIALGESHQDEISMTLSDMASNRKATKAYMQNSG